MKLKHTTATTKKTISLLITRIRKVEKEQVQDEQRLKEQSCRIELKPIINSPGANHVIGRVT